MPDASGQLATEIEVLRRQSKTAWDSLEEVVADVTADQANWWPPGTANSIGSIYLHVVINADVEINRLIHRRTPLVESEWSGEVGQGSTYDPGRFDRWVRHAAVDWGLLRDYGREVHRAVSDSLESLTVEQLDLPVDMTRAGLGVWQARDLYELHGMRHVLLHAGEIACLKGIQGGIGWAESEAFRSAVIVEDLGE
jgi:hypothetical protein